MKPSTSEFFAVNTRAVGFMIALLFVIPVSQAEEVSDYGKFRLWNDCEPIDLVVERLHDDAGEIGLTEERIQTTVESRLRGARIYTEDKTYLYVNVAVVGRSFSIGLSLNFLVYREANSGILQGVASTWESGFTGTHGGDAGYILQSVAEHTDRFINEYLRVNAEACG